PNSLTQSGLNSTRLPTLAAVSRKVMVQIFSRSALENSQLPAIERGCAAGSAGSVTLSASEGGVSAGAGGACCAASGADKQIDSTAASGARRIMREIITPSSSAAR